MGLLDLFSNKKVKELQLQNLELKRLASISFANLTANTNLVLWPEQTINQQTDRYITTDDIYSIIKRLATTAALVPIYGYLKTKDEKSFNKLLHYNYKHLKPKQYKNLQTKALEDLPEVDPVAMLLEKPHETMGKFEFFVELFSWLFLDGECFLRKERPQDGVNTGMPVKLAFMPPQCVIHRITQTVPHRITGLERQTLQAFKWVSERTCLTRVKDLSFNHHRQVAALGESEQIYFLNKALQEKLSVAELRLKIIYENTNGSTPKDVRYVNDSPFPLRLGELHLKLQQEAFEMKSTIHERALNIIREYFDRKEGKLIEVK